MEIGMFILVFRRLIVLQGRTFDFKILSTGQKKIARLGQYIVFAHLLDKRPKGLPD